MRLRSVLLLLLAAVAASATVDGRAAAQAAEQSIARRYPPEWENDRFLVRRIAIAPGAQISATEGADSVLVFLTADLEGRMPPAEAAWLPRGPDALTNRGSVRFEAIAIGLKDAQSSSPGVTPPEAVPGIDAAEVRVLIDNSRVIVLKMRYPSNAYSGPLHFHPHDTVVVYLSGGYTWPVNGEWGQQRVTRGDVGLVPANTLHAFANAGFDPLEFLVIVLK